MPTREELSGDFTDFANARLPDLVRIARALTGNPHAADDLVQTALEKAYRAWHRVHRTAPDAQFAYVRRILVNSSYDSWRRKVRLQNLIGRRVEPEDRAAQGPGPEDQAVSARTVDALLAPLTPRERQVLVLRCLADLSEADTARELGLAVGTIKSTTARALNKLRATVPTPIGV
ncbi:SigE family RNA polymerase sigma factor [Tessaracoccus lubricantis]|uniref:SigE family RNA polymerase sigma factor n=1 Tax=Tessaracoccus lubricantis TaxID=545543 RepID=A0ABP9EXH5_9ACTN